jgi:K+-sensing histidine kinase KdpD
MVSNALSMRSIESGSLEMHVAPFNPREAVVALLQVCRMGCTQQSTIEWINQLEPLPRLVSADCAFLSQILQNLVRALRCVAMARSCADVKRTGVVTLGDQRGQIRERAGRHGPRQLHCGRGGGR